MESSLYVSAVSESECGLACIRNCRRPLRLQSYIQHDADLHTECDKRCDAITDKWKCDTGIRHQTGCNAYIQSTLEHNQRTDSDTDEHALFLPGTHTDPETHQGDDKLQDYDQHAACKSQFFACDRKYKVCLRLCDKVSVLDGVDGIVVQAFSVQLSGSDRNDGVLLLVGCL